MHMRTVGDVRVSRVIEMEGPSFAIDDLFPDADGESVAAALAAEGDWLLPRFIDPESRFLIMSLHSFVIRTARHVILVDTCVGNDKERPGRDAWHRRDGPFLDRLAEAGVRPEDVDVVLCTHLHVDHVGWNTRLVDGRWVPTFPNARYIFARREYAFWEAKAAAAPAGTVNVGSYDDSVLPVVVAGQAIFVDDDHEIEDGLWLEPAPGHTPGNIILNLVSGGTRAAFTGDVMHHPLQLVRPDWSSRFCEDPGQSRATRRALIERFAESGTLILPAHFPTPTVGHIEPTASGFRLGS